ncbi:MAG: hypothetical protein ACOKSU_11525 [Pseudomonas sp.]|uniref:hypothetical protein n=1 Tax=Pseudomonas TaxID=286 RepID=UPI0003C08994|nr:MULTISPECIES: hypothetical protein [unclassified Pseudomonas]AGZ34885.1 lipoprotein [Pseudomonas sp. VLB120]QQZ38204.1 hypothetical protein IF103_09900 [Pseudomonas sp. SK2]
MKLGVNTARAGKPILGLGVVALLAGCGDDKTNTFTLIGELPPNFSYHGVAWYRHESDPTCDAGGFRGVSINKDWRKNYLPVTTIEIRKVVKGCPMVVRHLELKIRAKYGSEFHQFTGDPANIGIYEVLEEKYHREFNEANEDVFYGVCQWMFRTMGRDRVIRKLLACRKDNERGERGLGHPFAAYTLDQLPGKTVRMNIRVGGEESPSWGDTWVKFPNGWKRCKGRGPEDVRGYCNGNHTDFSEFTMPDGRRCTIYPGCEE